jgi:hypothetical protein
MRTFVQLSLLQVNPPTPVDAVKNWLEEARLRPQSIALPHEITRALLEADHPSESLANTGNTPTDHAINILSTIPRFDLERADAIRTAHYSIHLDDRANNATVWGLVCIDGPSVTIRSRHRSTKSLQYATERLIELVLDHAGPGKLFHEFEPNHHIPVREPYSTNDAYSGTVLGRKRDRVALARAESKPELWISAGAFVAALICTYAGYRLFKASGPDDVARWVSGALDRLATTGLATAAVSYMGYFFRKRQFIEKSIIHWD